MTSASSAWRAGGGAGALVIRRTVVDDEPFRNSRLDILRQYVVLLAEVDPSAYRRYRPMPTASPTARSPSNATSTSSRPPPGRARPGHRRMRRRLPFRHRVD